MIRKDNKTLILDTPQRKWNLASKQKSELDHWEQLIAYIIFTEKNKARNYKPKPNVPKSKPPTIPQSQTEQSNNNAIRHDNATAHDRHISIAAYNPEYVNLHQINDEQKLRR